MTKLELMIMNTEWQIKYAKDNMEEFKSKIEREMESFNPVTSPEWLLHYSQKLKEYSDKAKEQEQTLALLKNLLED